MLTLLFGLQVAFSADCYGDVAIRIDNPVAFEKSLDDGANLASAVVGLLPGVSSVAGFVLSQGLASDGLRHAAALVAKDLREAGVVADVWLARQPTRSGWVSVGPSSYIPGGGDMMNDLMGDTPNILVRIRDPQAAARSLRLNGADGRYGGAANELALAYLNGRFISYRLVGEGHTGAGYCR